MKCLNKLKLWRDLSMAKVQRFLGKEYLVSDYDLIQWDNKQPIAWAKIVMPLTANDIDSIVCGAIEGGIGYWARIDRGKTNHWVEKPKNITASDWVTVLLLNGVPVWFHDCEDPEEKWELTLAKLQKGFELNYMHRPHDCDLDNADASTYDCIIQYALFGKLVYG